MSEAFDGHDENEHDCSEHEHDKTCMAHDEHWQDDFAYTSTKRLPVPENAPRTAQMAKMIGELDDVPIYRFALVYVDAKTGNVQLASSPGVSPSAAMNLLAKAISTLAFQEAYQERIAEQMLHRGLGQALAKAMVGEGEMPDLTSILGGEPDELKPVDDIKNMRDGYL